PTQQQPTQQQPTQQQPTQQQPTQQQPPTQQPPVQELPIQQPPNQQPSSLTPARPIRNYVGIGGNIGFNGETALGESSFTIYSKIGLSNNFSVRPAVAVSDNAVFLLPVTFDFPVQSTTDFGEEEIRFVPYIGGGAAISTDDDSDIGALVTGGIDVRISPQFTATAGLNVGFLDDTNVGLLLGIGYNF
ncbi:MAG: hypothetical protein SAL70_41665, partial [Scytonema sp. PMC 1070.18]|nr:hypothetical protein [Scytonema sp. PMC 1070.18]